MYIEVGGWVYPVRFGTLKNESRLSQDHSLEEAGLNGK